MAWQPSFRYRWTCLICSRTGGSAVNNQEVHDEMKGVIVTVSFGEQNNSLGSERTFLNRNKEESKPVFTI